MASNKKLKVTPLQVSAAEGYAKVWIFGRSPFQKSGHAH